MSSVTRSPELAGCCNRNRLAAETLCSPKARLAMSRSLPIGPAELRQLRGILPD